MTVTTQQKGQIEKLCKQAQELTQEMRHHQNELAAKGTERRFLLNELRLAGVKQRVIAEICGVSRQTILVESKRFTAET